MSERGWCRSSWQGRWAFGVTGESQSMRSGQRDSWECVAPDQLDVPVTVDGDLGADMGVRSVRHVRHDVEEVDHPVAAFYDGVERGDEVAQSDTRSAEGDKFRFEFVRWRKCERAAVRRDSSGWTAVPDCRCLPRTVAGPVAPARSATPMSPVEAESDGILTGTKDSVLVGADSDDDIRVLRATDVGRSGQIFCQGRSRWRGDCCVPPAYRVGSVKI